jgi:hypothetical protein
MALVHCNGCEAVHESTLLVCPGCGRCPGCGQKRVSRTRLKELWLCPNCQVPYCAGCGRCHICGLLRFTNLEVEPCDCGHPSDHNLEKWSAVSKKPPGCLPLLALAVGLAFCYLI